MPQTASQKWFDYLKEVEGVCTNKYQDSAGYWSIGMGHKLTPQEINTGIMVIKGKAVHWRDGLSFVQIGDLADQDNDYAEAVINKYVTVPLTQDMFDGLLSFIYNIGAGAFIGSSLLRKLNQKMYSKVGDMMKQWVWVKDKKGKKVKSPGLINRRQKDADLFNGKR